jgi:hypothetical protein
MCLAEVCLRAVLTPACGVAPAVGQFGSMYEVLIKTSAQPFCTVAADVFALGNSGGKLATMVRQWRLDMRRNPDG